MSESVEEIYTEEGKKLFELVQEWIDENNSFFNCKENAKAEKYSCR